MPAAAVREISPVRTPTAAAGTMPAAWGMPVANQVSTPIFIPQGAMIWAVRDDQAGLAPAPPLWMMHQIQPFPGMPNVEVQRSPEVAKRGRSHHGHHGAPVRDRLNVDGDACVPEITLGRAQLNHNQQKQPQLSSVEAEPQMKRQPFVENQHMARPASPSPPTPNQQHGRSVAPSPPAPAPILPVPPPTPEEAAAMELKLVLRQKGYSISDHKQYNAGLPAGVLGKGNFGCVYKATGHGAPWAIKKIEKASTYEFLTKKEIEVLRLLPGHPNIVSLADTIAHPSRDWIFLVLEFVEGGDLLGGLTKYPHIFDEALVRAMMFFLACGLGFAHEAGVMHRDLKPENILLTKDLMPKIADFGLARIVKENEVCRTIAGTPGYMAPEVLDVRVPYDFPADVFSLGLVFADMLNEKCCCQWWIEDKPQPVKERYLKKWPADKTPSPMSAKVFELQRKMVAHIPGERTTAYQLCVDLLHLGEEQPMPCQLWSATPSMPSAPPPQKTISPADAAEIAGRLGYAKGCVVLVWVNGQWIKGKVEHISTGLCPGGAQVRYKTDQGDQMALVSPGKFAELLRPAPQEPFSVERSIVTMDGDAMLAEKLSQRKDAERKKRRLVPEATESRCKPASCCVQ